MSQILEVQNLRAKSREGKYLSPAVSFELLAGEVLFLRGENGAGKSTLLKTLLGLHKYYEGQFHFLIPDSDIQYLPQLGNLHFHLPLTLKDMLSSSEDIPASLIKGIDLDKKWNTASGGERQKILLAATLGKKPRLLVLDEPFNHVDKESIQVLEEALAQFLKEHPESSLVLVSHRAFIQDWAKVRFLEIR
ncbi:ATP-binding cassette domain-containing protein [Bdellovibrio sp. BCCA]|uniref:ATP-binding cassette domain-containing protein n=1 Tax=Bdellovibrio sp. BCCA TaxID=3136281 RepID=UPI0030EFBE0B